MNWTRSILDGLAMAAYFNLFAAAAALYKPRLMFPCYPSAIIPLCQVGAKNLTDSSKSSELQGF